MQADIEIFKKDRNEALLSLNKENIIMFGKKYKVEFSSDDYTFWLSIHKAITGCTSLPIEFRRKSKEYLTQRNSESMDDGDL